MKNSTSGMDITLPGDHMGQKQEQTITHCVPAVEATNFLLSSPYLASYPALFSPDTNPSRSPHRPFHPALPTLLRCQIFPWIDCHQTESLPKFFPGPYHIETFCNSL